MAFAKGNKISIEFYKKALNTSRKKRVGGRAGEGVLGYGWLTFSEVY
jgi:hypothetical protein